jgi:hypothetical protein
MEKLHIKKLLREGLSSIQVTEDEDKNLKKGYSDIRNALKKQGRTQVWLMYNALGWVDDESGSKRSYFRKLLFQEPNEEGSIHEFDDEQLASIRTSLDIT